MQYGKAVPMLALAAIAVVGVASSAEAQCGSVVGNMVQNCGFETGDFTGWTMGTPFITSNWNKVAGGMNAHTGSDGWWGGYIGQPTFLSQTLTTVAGQEYNFGFWFNSPYGQNGQPNAMVARWDGVDVVNLVDPPIADWTYYSFDVVASGASTTFEIGLQQDLGYEGIDDVQVTTATDAAPEPAALVYMVTGLIGVAGIARRRRSAR